MNKSIKENIKDCYFELHDKFLSDPTNYIEIQHLLRQACSISSCSIEFGEIPPQFVKLNPTEEQLRYWEKCYPDYYNLFIEIENHHSMLLALEKQIENKKEFDTTLLLELHLILYKRTHYNQAGKFRDGNNKLNHNNNPLSHCHMLPEQLEQHFNWLENRLSFIGTVTIDNFYEIFHIAAEAAYRVYETEPFPIGNGIISRLIGEYILIHSGLIYNPIDYSHIKAHKKALKETNFNNISPLSNFMMENFSENLENIKKIAII